VAKLAPDTERLAGSVAPKSKRFKANLGKARFVHQKAKVYIVYIDNIELPSSLDGWTDLHLVETFKLTRNLKLREIVAKELEKRIQLSHTNHTSVNDNKNC